MSDEVKRNFARNLERLLESTGLSQSDLAKRVGVSTSSVSDWLTEKKMPRTDKIVAIADIFGVHFSELLQEHAYYTNTETQRIAQEIYEDRDLRLLFDAAKDAAPEDLQAVHAMLKALKAKEHSHED